MKLKTFNWILILLTTACHHGGAQAQRDDRNGHYRLARAQVVASDGSSVKGTVDFEQMPNSVIVVFRIEGLEPKNNFQLLIQEDSDCKSLDLRSAEILSKIRSNKTGTAEHTFKTVHFSVSAEKSLVGSSVIVASKPFETGNRPPVLFACGEIEPLSPTNALNQ